MARFQESSELPLRLTGGEGRFGGRKTGGTGGFRLKDARTIFQAMYRDFGTFHPGED
jgi:hypothetical protein